MFIDKLFAQSDAPLLERVLSFTAARHEVLAENIVNVDTPGYRQKDLSVARFREMLRSRLEKQQSAPPGSVRLDDIPFEAEHPEADILYHDGGNRSVEQLMSEQAKNAMLHNFAVELLRKQYQTMEMALKDKPL